MAFKVVILAALLAVANAGYLGGPAAYSSVAYGAAPVAYGAAPVAHYGAVASPALVSQHANVLRTPGNLGQVSTYSKTINTPYSSVSKSDVRVSNDAVAYHGYAAPAVAAYAAPAYHGAAYAAPAYHGAAYAAPAVTSYASPAYHGAAYAAPAAYSSIAYGAAPVAHYGAVASPALVSQHSNILRTPGNLGQVSTYSKTINTPHSSVSKSDVRVSNDAIAYQGYAAPAVAAYAAPAYHGAAYAAPSVTAYGGYGYGAPAVAAYGGYGSPVVRNSVSAVSGLGVAYSAAPAVAHMTYSNGYGINYAY